MIAAHLTRLVHTLRQNCHDPADDELLARFSEHGDAAAFETVVRRHGPAVLAACRQVLSEPADVDDVFQATFLTLLQRSRAVRRGASVGCWLYGVAHRIALRARDTAVRRRGLLRHAARPGVVEPADLSWPEACAILHEELDRLPDRLRLPLLLCYLEGQSRDEAARNLGWTVGAVKGCLERGRRILADRLTRRGIALSAGLLIATVATTRATAGPSARLVEATLLAAVQPSPAVAVLAAPATLAPRTVLAAGLLLAGILAVFVLHAPPAEGDPPQPAPPAPAPPADPMGQTFTYAGRVLGPDGKPLPGAKVHICGLNPGVIQFAERSTTGKDGTFRFTVRRDEFGDKGVVPAHRSPPERFVHLAATADGYGSAGAWRSQPDQRENVTIRLPAEEIVKGRVIDLEGRPIAGVRVGLSLSGVPADRDSNPIPYDPKHEPAHYMTTPAAPSDQGAVTDADGRVTIRSLGQGWMYDLYISGPTVVNARARLVARPRKPGVAEASGLWMPDRGPPRVPEFGSEFTFVATPSKPIRGTVREKGSGRPLAGCHVHIPFTRDDDPRALAETDAAGRYTLSGLPRGRYTVVVQPPEGTPYLETDFTVDAGDPGTAPVTADLELERRSAAAGRVTDAATGRPVAGRVEYRPLAKNPALKAFPKLAEPDVFRHPTPTARLDKAGRFLLPVLPGPGVILVQAEGAYLPAGPSPVVAHPEDPGLIDCRPSPAIPSEFHACQVIDAEAGKEFAVKIPLTPDRPRPLAIESPDDKPRDLGVLGLKPVGVDRGEFVHAGTARAVCGLAAGERRRLFLQTQDHQFAAALTVDGSAAGPVAVKLQPTGTITGRLLDKNGKPLKEVAFKILYDDGPGRPGVMIHGGSVHRAPTPIEEKRHQLLTGTRADKMGRWTQAEKTDADGRFRVGGVIPSVAFDLYAQLTEPDAKVARPTVKSGETHNLGDLTVGEVEKE